MASSSKHQVSKRKKLVPEFAADSIDNTAPVKKLLDDLQHKNNKAYEFYCQTIRQRKTTKKNLQNLHFILSGHPLYDFKDDWEGDVNHGYFEELGFKSTLPKMITQLRNLQKSDPVIELIKLKSDWQNANRAFRSAAVYSNLVRKYESLNEEVAFCPKHFIDIAAHLDSDPDHCFDSCYNWYYAGNGNMQRVCFDGTDYILHSEFNFLYLSELSKGKLAIKHDSVPKFDCGENNNILETVCSKQHIVALRTKNKVFILKIVTSNGTSDIEKLKVSESQIPYTGVSFDNFHSNILYITTLDNKLTIVNIDRMKGRHVTLESKANSVIDNWNTVIGSERAYYTHIARNSVTVYDKRSNNSIHTWQDIRNVTDDITCNDICVAKQIEDTPSLYFGTDHHLFLMDLRYYAKHKSKVVQRWTHGMQCVPTYISTCNYGYNEELLCLSSQWCEDMCVIKNPTFSTNTKSEYFGITNPYRPPSILKTLSEAREKLLCFDLYNPIDSRLCTAITGNSIFVNGDKYRILMQNSLGDISCHFLYPEHMEIFIEDDSAEELHEWSKNYEIEKKNFEVSSVEDISKIWRLLKKIPEDYRIGEGDQEFRQKTKFDENEIFDAFDNEEIDSGLLDQWTDNKNCTTKEQSSLALNLHFSDSE